MPTAVKLLLVAVTIALSVQISSGQCKLCYHVLKYNDPILFFFSQQHTVTQLTVSGCTIHMAALLLKVVCCRSAYQAGGEQCVITALAVPHMEKLLVDNLDSVEARSVSLNWFTWN